MCHLIIKIREQSIDFFGDCRGFDIMIQRHLLNDNGAEFTDLISGSPDELTMGLITAEKAVQFFKELLLLHDLQAPGVTPLKMRRETPCGGNSRCEREMSSLPRNWT